MRGTCHSDPLPAAAVFAGSLLLFLLQPLLGRTLLPPFGGSAAVWTVCLAAFQTLLLVGYAYTHLLGGFGARARRLTHLTLAGFAVAWALAAAALGPALRLRFGASSAPGLEVLACVLLLAGPPYVFLSAGSTWVQAWLAAGEEEGRPADAVYGLYAVSNAGSLAGLLLFPFALEPFVPLTVQWYGFAAGLAFYALLVAALALRRPSPRGLPARGEPPPRPAPPAARGLWFALPAASAFLLNAVVAHLFIDVTPMPLVWVLALAAFLLSYVLGFSRLGGRTGLWAALSAAALAGSAVADGRWGTGSFYPNAAAAAALLVCVGTLLHGWLYAERPGAAGLTRYYLLIAAGGAAGGLLAALGAPLLFDRVTEYPLILFVCALLTAWRAPKPAFMARSPRRARLFAAGCAAAWLALATAEARRSQARTLFRDRNFYGCVAVTETVEEFGREGALPVRYLWCGRTTHGIQVGSPQRRERATAYYGETGGGIALLAHPKRKAGQGMKVGVVGLGAGTLACYGRPQDLFRFYELNPLVTRVAGDPRLFTFLSDARCPVDLVPGDARRMLERERASGDPLYDTLVIDAYSGDAVPYHLATREAFRLYFDRLAPDGLLAVHVSNWHIDLLPLCKAAAAALGASPYGVVGVAEDSVTSGSIWVFMTRQPMGYAFPAKRRVREVVWSEIRDVSVPTDERGSLIPLLRF